MKKAIIVLAALLIVLAAANLFLLVDDRIQYNEEKEADPEESINTLEGGVFFDLNGNFRLDESDVQVIEPVRLTMVQHFPESENIYDSVSEKGYHLTIPSTAEIIRIYLNSSTEELNGIINPTDQNIDFRVFRFKLTNETEKVDELWQSDGSVVWIPKGESIVDILIIGIE